MSRKISPDDEGEIEIGIAVDVENKVVRIRFPKPMLWMAFEYDEAVAFAYKIIEKAQKLKSDEN